MTAYEGAPDTVLATTNLLAEKAFSAIDLNRHVGVHPRIGALDVCPFVLLSGADVELVAKMIDEFAHVLAERYDLPVYLYEKSEKGLHESTLPELRKGGFGGLFGKELFPDFGPNAAHPLLGAAVVGLRDFLIAMNVNLRTEDLTVARTIARKMRHQRQEGNPDFLGVRALGLPLASRNLTQVSMNLTLPDICHPDPLIEWIRSQAIDLDVAVEGTELIGVIRDIDLPHSQRLRLSPEQVVRTE